MGIEFQNNEVKTMRISVISFENEVNNVKMVFFKEFETQFLLHIMINYQDNIFVFNYNVIFGLLSFVQNSFNKKIQ